MTRSSTVLPLVILALAGATQARAEEDVDRLALDATHGIAPQPARPADLFRRARPYEGERFEGAWVCEVRVSGESWDGNDPLGPVRRYMGRVELDAEIVLPERNDYVRYRGPDDQNRVTFVVAGVGIDRGESVRMGLVDRDVLTNDPIGNADLVYEGSLPIQVTLEHAAIECRGLPADTLASDVADAIADADAALAALGRAASPDAAILGFRDPTRDPSAATRAVYGIARLTGLADPRFLQRRDALREREATYLSTLTGLVRQLASRASALGTPVTLDGGNVRLEVERYDCEVTDVLDLHPELGLDTPMDCALHLRVHNPGAATTIASAFHLVDELGETVALVRYASIDESGPHRMRSLRIAPGDTRLVFAAPMRRALLLRVSRRRSVQWLLLKSADAPDAADPVSRIRLRERSDVTPDPAAPR